MHLDITNKREFERMLKELPKGYDSKFLQKLLRFSAKPMLNYAKSKVRVVDGLLKSRIKLFPTKYSPVTGMILGVKMNPGGTRETEPYYAHMVEYGHRIVTPGKKDTGKSTQPRPFMRPAWDTQKDVVTKRFMESAKRKFEQEVARLSKKGVL